MAVPLDEKIIVLPAEGNTGSKIPALDVRWKDNIKFVKYEPPTRSLLSDSGECDQWLERLAFIEEDLAYVLRLPHNKFWCQVVFDASLHGCIDSYLKYAFRPHQEVCLELPEKAKTVLQSVHRLVFMVCLRMATHKESKDHYITPHVFGEIVYENFIFDIPKLMDLCAVYGAGNGPLLSKMIKNIFQQQSKYEDDLRATVSTMLQVLDNMKAEHDAANEAVASRETPGMASDMMLFLIDTCKTLLSFLDIYPDAARILTEEDFPVRLAGVYEWVYPMLRKSLKCTRSKTRETHMQQRALFHKTLTGLITLFQQIVFRTCLQPILDNSGESVVCVGQFLNNMSAVLSHPKFLTHHERMFPFSDMLDILSQSTYVVDGMTVEFIQRAINEVRVADSGREHRHMPATSAPDTNLMTESAQSAQVTCDGDVGASKPGQRLTPIQLDSLVTSVKDVLPHLGDGFILHCLEVFDYNFEQVINAVLEDKLPPSLQQLDTAQPRGKPLETEVEEQASALTYRKNVYDDDEFDVFHRDDVDTSKIHQGKKERAIAFEDKETIDQLRPLYNRYGNEFVESMYEKTEDYEDEYDDTYDSHEVGADDVDSAEELVNASHRFKLTEADASDEEMTAEEKEKRRNYFVEDPAKIREREAARWATKMGQRRPQRPQPSHDVKGVAKGQGQTSETVHNRAWKEKHKSTRVHHNRKALADKKRRV